MSLSEFYFISAKTVGIDVDVELSTVKRCRGNRFFRSVGFVCFDNVGSKGDSAFLIFTVTFVDTHHVAIVAFSFFQSFNHDGFVVDRGERIASTERAFVGRHNEGFYALVEQFGAMFC